MANVKDAYRDGLYVSDPMLIGCARRGLEAIMDPGNAALVAEAFPESEEAVDEVPMLVASLGLPAGTSSPGSDAEISFNTYWCDLSDNKDMSWVMADVELWIDGAPTRAHTLSIEIFVRDGSPSVEFITLS